MSVPGRTPNDGHAARERAATPHRPVVADEVALLWLQLAGFTPRESQRLLFLRWLWQRGRLSEFPPGR